MRRKSLIILSVLFLLILIPSGVALAYDKVVAAGETIHNDIVLFDDDLVVEAGATVNGDVTIFDGNAQIDGTVNGDVVLFDGDLTAAGTAVINGDCVVMSGTLEDATISGLDCTDFSVEIGSLVDEVPSLVGVPTTARSEPSGFVLFLGGVAGVLFQSLFLGLIAFGVATLFPRHLGEVQSTLRQKPVASGAVGFLTAISVPFLLVLLSPLLVILAFICGLGILITLAVVLGLAGAVLFGWIGLGQIFGQRLADIMKLRNWSLPATTALGTAAISLLLGLFAAISFGFGGGLVAFVLTCVGLGAVTLTKFGTKSYPRLGGDGDIQILMPEDEDKVNVVLDTLPEDSDTLK